MSKKLWIILSFSFLCCSSLLLYSQLQYTRFYEIFELWYNAYTNKDYKQAEQIFHNLLKSSDISPILLHNLATSKAMQLDSATINSWTVSEILKIYETALDIQDNPDTRWNYETLQHRISQKNPHYQSWDQKEQKEVISNTSSWYDTIENQTTWTAQTNSISKNSINPNSWDNSTGILSWNWELPDNNQNNLSSWNTTWGDSFEKTWEGSQNDWWSIYSWIYDELSESEKAQLRIHQQFLDEYQSSLAKDSASKSQTNVPFDRGWSLLEDFFGKDIFFDWWTSQENKQDW